MLYLQTICVDLTTVFGQHFMICYTYKLFV